MNKTLLTMEECSKIYVGEAITVAGVMAILIIAIAAIVAYKLFTSSKGSATIPGGYKFEWK